MNVLKALVCYQLIDPGSEFRFHREWYVRSAIGDLLGEDYSLVQKDKPYRCLDLLFEHRDNLFVYLKEKWGKRFGYSRDKRSDCVQVMIALVLTPEGFPVSYEVYPGNMRDTAT